MKKYFRTFDTHSEYEAFTGTSEFILPNVSWCRDDIYTVHYTPTVDVTGVTLNESTLSLSEGDSATLVATVMPADATHKDVTWNSSDESVATVSSGGVVTTVGTGSCTITVTTVEGGFTAQCDVSVIHEYSKTYLTFIALESGTFKIVGNNKSVYYSIDDGVTWETLASDTNTPTVDAGDKIMWKASGLTATSTKGIGSFSSTCNYIVEGNVMSMIYADDFEDKTTIVGNYALRGLFSECTHVINAENMILPATTLSNQYSYAFMFYNCTNLVTAPSVLPAITLSERCYQSMFDNCYNLVTPPTSIGDSNTTMSINGCLAMFQGCTSLTTAPELPAETLATSAYTQMFSGCTSLTTAPELPATTLADSCYRNMFAGCTGLTASLELPATTLADSCYRNMFSGCTSLTTAPELPATTLEGSCYYSMFQGCTNLNSITCLATDISATNCRYYWVSGVQTTSGTFTKAASMTSWPIGVSGIPKNWTVVDASS